MVFERDPSGAWHIIKKCVMIAGHVFASEVVTILFESNDLVISLLHCLVVIAIVTNTEIYPTNEN